MLPTPLPDGLYVRPLEPHDRSRGGERRDSAYYSVIDDDWLEVRANLERRLEKHLRQRDERREEGDTDT